MGGAGLSRRSLLSGALAAGLLGGGVLSACSGPIAGATSRLAFWHLMSGGDGIRMDEILSSMAADGAGAAVKQTVLSWGTPYYTKLAMSSAGGRAPDMAIMHLSRLAGYAPGGLLDPWDVSRFEKYGVSADTFAGAIFDRMHVGEDLFAISLDSHAFIRFFNSEIADAAGVLDSDGKLLPTATVDEFIEQAVAMQGVTGDLGLSWGWLGDSSHIWRFFWTLYTQQGASMSVEDGALQYEPDAFMGALQTMIALISSPAAYRRSDGGFAYSKFTSGDSGQFLTGVWELPGLLDAGIPLDASPIPNLFGTGIDAVWGDSHAFVLPHQNDTDEERREQVYEVISLILKRSLVWSSAGHTPAYLPILDEPGFTDLHPNGSYAETATYLHFDPAMSFAGSGSNWQASFGGELQGALLGSDTPEQAKSNFEAMTADFIRRAVI